MIPPQLEIKKQIKATSDDISNQNKDIEEKANYLESKINSYKKEEIYENKSLLEVSHC